MKEIRYFYAPDAASTNELPEEEAVHAVRSLRLEPDDEIMLMDGCGSYYKAVVTMTTKSRCLYRIIETVKQERQWKGHVHLAVAPTKMMERMEWMIEKATEIGFDELSLLNCRFSERHNVKIGRLDKIVVSAVKQSRKGWKPIINDIENFKDFIKRPFSGRKYIAHCYDEIERSYLFTELGMPSDNNDCLILIGPEGDFSLDEVKEAVDNGFVSVHLGKSRLRTETAGLSAVMMAQLSM